jgi:hypothetical protein
VPVLSPTHARERKQVLTHAQVAHLLFAKSAQAPHAEGSVRPKLGCWPKIPKLHSTRLIELPRGVLAVGLIAFAESPLVRGLSLQLGPLRGSYRWRSDAGWLCPDGGGTFAWAEGAVVRSGVALVALEEAGVGPEALDDEVDAE